MFTKSKARRGFSLIEVLAAILIIDIGLLALVAASAVLVRRVNDMRAQSIAVRVAATRLETLGARACEAGAGDSLLSNGAAERWSETLSTPLARTLRDSVMFGTLAAPRIVFLETTLPC